MSRVSSIFSRPYINPAARRTNGLGNTYPSNSPVHIQRMGKRGAKSSSFRLIEPILTEFPNGLCRSFAVENRITGEKVTDVRKGAQILFKIGHGMIPEDRRLVVQPHGSASDYGDNIWRESESAADFVWLDLINYVKGIAPALGPKDQSRLYVLLKVIPAIPELDGEIWKTTGYLIGIQLNLFTSIEEINRPTLFLSSAVQQLEIADQKKKLKKALSREMRAEVAKIKNRRNCSFLVTVQNLHFHRGTQTRSHKIVET